MSKATVNPTVRADCVAIDLLLLLGATVQISMAIDRNIATVVTLLNYRWLFSYLYDYELLGKRVMHHFFRLWIQFFFSM